MRPLLILVISMAASITSSLAQDAPVRAGPAASAELHAELQQLDQTLFTAAFNDCQPDKISGLIAEDFEFYHDKDGLISQSGTDFIESLKRICADRETGQSVEARRELVAGSMQVYPLNNYGAIQIGRHRFYGISADGSKTLRETAQFTHLWHQTGDGWQLTRVLSYDHQPAAQ